MIKCTKEVHYYNGILLPKEYWVEKNRNDLLVDGYFVTLIVFFLFFTPEIIFSSRFFHVERLKKKNFKKAKKIPSNTLFLV